MEKLVIIRGAGELATGIAHRLFNAGYKVMLLEKEYPSAIRRNIVFAEAVYDGEKRVERVTCYKANNLHEAEKLLKKAASQEDYAEAYGLFGQTVNDVFSVCFGAENAQRIAEHFGGDYIEMSLAVVPYIYEVVLPKVNEVIARRRTALKRIYNRR